LINSRLHRIVGSQHDDSSCGLFGLLFAAWSDLFRAVTNGSVGLILSLPIHPK